MQSDVPEVIPCVPTKRRRLRPVPLDPEELAELAEPADSEQPKGRRREVVSLSEDDDRAPPDVQDYVEDGFCVNVPLREALNHRRAKGENTEYEISTANIVQGKRRSRPPKPDVWLQRALRKVRDDFALDDYAAAQHSSDSDASDSEDYTPGDDEQEEPWQEEASECV